jgi:hypothetical protein
LNTRKEPFVGPFSNHATTLQVTGPSRSYNPGGDPPLATRTAQPPSFFTQLTQRLGASRVADTVSEQLKPIDNLITGERRQHTPIMSDRGPFRFLSVFKWEARKGWDILLRGYFLEFSAEDDVELHIVTHAFGAQVRAALVRVALSCLHHGYTRLSDEHTRVSCNRRRPA